MKTKTINPGWYSFMLILLAIALAILMNSCDCYSDDGVLTFSEAGTGTVLALGFIMLFISLFIMGSSELENTGVMILAFILFLVGLMLFALSIRNLAYVSAIDSQIYQKQYIYKSVNDSLYYVVDSVYIRTR